MFQLTLFRSSLALLLLWVVFSGADAWAEEKPRVLVSIAPYKYFVERIAGDTVTVGLMVPPGASAHTYEPSPKEMIAASHAVLWFTLGESFEAKAVAALKSHNPSMLTVDLRKGIDLISDDPNHEHHHCCPTCNCEDLHIWLSPKQAKVQVGLIADTLSTLYPANKGLYGKNVTQLLDDLTSLDKQIAEILAPVKPRAILVSHPAYGYFCRDYSFRQLSVEFEGKDPTPRQLTRVLDEARKYGIKKVFVQPQYNNKGAKLVASEIGAQVIMENPYSEHYFTNMIEFAREIASVDRP